MPIDEAMLLSEGWKPLRNSGPYLTLAGTLWRRRLATSTVYGFIADERHLNATGSVHGGLLVTLLDQVISITAWEAVQRQPVVTVQIDTQFVGNVRAGDWIVGEGRINRVTGSLVFVMGELRVGADCVASAQGVMKRMQRQSA